MGEVHIQTKPCDVQADAVVGEGHSKPEMQEGEERMVNGEEMTETWIQAGALRILVLLKYKYNGGYI